MGILETIKWQWLDYPKYHLDKGNLLIHIFAVPMMWTAAALFIVGIFRLSLLAILFAAFAFFISLVLQNIGHKREQNPPVPFAGKMDFFKRLLGEQFVTFPRFFFSGGWFKNFFGK